MKLCYFAAVLGLTLMSCSSDEPQKNTNEGTPQPLPTELGAIHRSALSASAPFDYEYFKGVNKALENQSESFVASPFGAKILLSILSNGAEDEAKDAIKQAMHCEDLATLNDACGIMLNSLAKPFDDAVVSCANSLWYDETETLKKDISDIFARCYNGAVYPCNRNDVPKLASDWISEQTHKLIDGLNIMPQPAVFANAFYINAKWDKPFDITSTHPGTFNGLTKISEAMMMHNTGNFDYAETSRYCMVDLPFANGAFILRLVLPNREADINAFMDNLDYEVLMSTKLQEKRIDLTLPRLTINPAEVEFQRSYEHLGLKILNGEKGLVSVFNSNKNTSFQIRQENMLEVSEDGLITASATWTDWDIMPTPTPVDAVVTFDRPFLLFLMGPEDICLLAGKIGDL